MLHPKPLIVLLFTYPHVNPNSYDFLSPEEMEVKEDWGYQALKMMHHKISPC